MNNSKIINFNYPGTDQVLTKDQLLNEYIDWYNTNGNERNSSGLRFGQSMHNNYAIFSTEIVIENDGYYTENAYKAYEEIYKVIIK